MNVGTAAAGYGYEYVVSTMDRVKAAASGSRVMRQLQMPIITPVAVRGMGRKRGYGFRSRYAGMGIRQEERGIDMEVETAAAVSCFRLQCSNSETSGIRCNDFQD